MSITHIEIRSLERLQDKEPQLSVGKVTFDHVCVVNETELLQQYNVFWIREGRSNVRVDFQTYEVNAETMVFLSPGQVFTVLSDEIVRGYHLAFGEDFYCLDTHHGEIGCNGLLFSNFLKSPMFPLTPETAKELYPLFETILNNLLRSQVAQTELLQSYLKIFLIRCVQFRKEQEHHARSIDEPAIDWLTEFNRLVEKHFRKWHSVADYAKALHLSPKTMSNRLAPYGKRPSKVIYDRIILEAKRLLAHSNKTVQEITYELGFEEPSYFSRFFKKRVGLPPGQFREQFNQ